MKRTRKKQQSKKPSIAISSRKAKARELQKWTAEQIAKVTGYEHGKDKPIESRPMGQTGPDIRMEGAVLELFPFSVECKRQESWSVPAWIKQAKDNQIEETDWLLIARRSHEEPVVIIDATAFFEIIGQLISLRY